LSSTIEPARHRGQVLVIFALTLVTLLLFAALAYDTGTMLLERRDEQNAADAAALAGARYLPDDEVAAESAARAIATANGFTNGVGGVTVGVTFPLTGRIDVDIANTKASIFGGIVGREGWPVAARAVAVNQNDVAGPFAMLALEPEDCEAILVTGNGAVEANGNIQVNSTCTNGGLHRGGGGEITVTADGAACNVVGEGEDSIKDPGDKMECAKNTGAPSMPDPLGGLPAPDPQPFPTPPVQEGGVTQPIPAGCPGGTAEASEAVPNTCRFSGAYDGTVWRLYPGYYPGGIHLQAGTYYLEDGIYFLGGGGFTINGSGASATTVNGGTSLDFGIMLYNTEDPLFSSQCAAGTAPDPATQCIQPIDLNGSDASVNFYPLKDGSLWDGIVIYQDRNLDAPGDDLKVNGSSDGTSEMQVRGTIYMPSGSVLVNGNEGTVTVDQMIANTFKINGSDGSLIKVTFDSDFIFTLTAVGLIQ
jgi:hypothetical protein